MKAGLYARHQPRVGDEPRPSKSQAMLTARTEHLIDLALEEDTGLGDITSRAIFLAAHRCRAVIDARQDLVVCGLEIAARVFTHADAAIKVRFLARDGDRVKKGAKILRL